YALATATSSLSLHTLFRSLEAVAGGLGRGYEAGVRHRAQNQAVAEFGCRLGDGRAAAPLERFERADRRQQHRNAQLFAEQRPAADRKSTRLNSSHGSISYA